MIAGFRDASVIETDEQVPSSPAGAVSLERRQMSMIFQPIAAWPNMTVEEKIAFGLKIGSIDGRTCHSDS
jgi:ABC-type Fe3+/spermidine/putrescine transport system ATPase subunit